MDVGRTEPAISRRSSECLQMKIISVVGTRPNIVKEHVLHGELKRRGVEEVLVHTGQHYDYRMSQIFFEGFQLPQPHYHLDQKEKSNIQQSASILSAMEAILITERPTCTLVYGDVNSTLAAALASAKLRIPVVHVEGGVRSEHKYNPEEINRRLTDHLSSLVFACTQTDYDALLRENFSPSEVSLSGDLMKDSLLKAQAQGNIRVRSGGYVVATIHREENVEDKGRLTEIMEGLIGSGMDIVFPAHPRTLSRLKSYGLQDSLHECERIKLLKPQSYLRFLELLAAADCVLTDSGGVRREAYILGKPIVVPIGIEWFPEIRDCGWMEIQDPPSAPEIAHMLRNFRPTEDRPQIFGDGKAHRVIAKRIVEKFR